MIDSHESAMSLPVTVITINLNHGRGLRATAASIAEQSLKPFEWLVVDGGSSDESLDVIEEFAPAITAWWSAADRGVYDAMNRGLERARGAYVLFMNAGDRLADAEALARIADALRASDAPDLLLCGTVLDLPSGLRVYRSPRAPSRFLRFGLPAYHQATVIRRALHLEVPYDLALPISADYGAIAAMLSRGATWRCLDTPLAIRECDPNSLSERRTLARLADFVRVQRRILAMPWPALAVNLARQLLVWLAYVTLRSRRWRALPSLRAPMPQGASARTVPVPRS